MKKSLITLAIAGSFAATANAQTAVSMYGIVDMGLVSERGAAAGSVHSQPHADRHHPRRPRLLPAVQPRVRAAPCRLHR